MENIRQFTADEDQQRLWASTPPETLEEGTHDASFPGGANIYIAEGEGALETNNANAEIHEHIALVIPPGTEGKWTVKKKIVFHKV